MMCTKQLCPILMFTYFTKLFSRRKQEVNSSGHVTIYSKHATLHIFHGDPLLFQYLLEMH